MRWENMSEAEKYLRCITKWDPIHQFQMMLNLEFEFQNREEYEIEAELLPRKDIQISKEELIKKFKLVWRYILSGLQNTNYPISYIEQEKILESYNKLIQETKKKYRTQAYFIGPSPISLQFINIQDINPDVKVANIRVGYTVTEKADGLRKLLYFAPKHTMNTGAKYKWNPIQNPA